MDESGGRHSDSEQNTEDHQAHRQKQSKSKLSPELQSLSRCPDCYNHKAHFRSRWGGKSESSSSDEDFGSEVNSDSEAESSSSSSCFTGNIIEETPVRPVCEDTAEPDSGGQDVDGQAETSETPEDKGKLKEMLKRPQLIKSHSLPAFKTPHLTPLNLLPRPRQVTSTLHLQVLLQKHKNDTTYTIRRPERRGTLRRGGTVIGPPSVPFPWQRQPPHLQPDYIPPLKPQGQYIPPPLYTVPMIYAPVSYTQLQTLTAQPCRCYYCMYFPHTHWSHYSSTQLP